MLLLTNIGTIDDLLQDSTAYFDTSFCSLITRGLLFHLYVSISYAYLCIVLALMSLDIHSSIISSLMCLVCVGEAGGFFFVAKIKAGL